MRHVRKPYARAIVIGLVAGAVMTGSLIAGSLDPPTTAVVGGNPVPTQVQQVTACQTISTPGSYKLVNNLDSTGFTNCLTLTTNFVTIDLNGFAITGSAGRGIFSDLNTSITGITIRNGVIRNTGEGINMASNSPAISGVVVENVQLFVTNTAITLGRLATVRDTVVSGGGRGIIVGADSMVLRNNASNTTNNGISAGTAAGGSFIGNVANNNTQFGIVTGAGATVVNNTARGNGLVGLRVNCPSNVIGNTTTNNGITNLDSLGTASTCNFINNIQ